MKSELLTKVSSKKESIPILGELLAIAVTTNLTNRLANGYQIPVDERFKT